MCYEKRDPKIARECWERDQGGKKVAEYIEREVALVICEKEYQERLKMQDWCGDTVAWNIGHAIKAIPVADVAPVVHGRWDGEKDHGDFREVKCTACGGILLVKWSTRLSEYNYCPNCGARMDGDKK